MHTEVPLSAPFQYLVYDGGRHSVLPDQVADAQTFDMIVVIQLSALDRGQTGAFVNSHDVYISRRADCKQR